MEIRADKLRFFRTGAALRAWLEKHHATETELWIGFYKKDSGKSGLTYSKALDQALCFGWIDGIRKRLDDMSFANRFTPRKPRSVWSNINIEHIARLTKAGLMAPAGAAAFALRDPARSGVYSFEQDKPDFTPAMRRRFSSNHDAIAFFESQPPNYRQNATWWLVSAKRPETRERRLDQLIERSASGLRLKQFIPVRKSSGLVR